MRRSIIALPVLALACGAASSVSAPVEIPAAVTAPAPSAPAPSSAAPATPSAPKGAPAPVAAAEPADAPDDPEFPRARDWRASGAKLATTGPDEPLYDDALRFERQGNAAQARRSYYELISKHPSSPLVPYAYFAFGEMFWREAQSDPSKLALAQQAYSEVTKYASSPITPEAWSRLAQVHSAQGDSAKAAAARQRLQREFANSDAAKREKQR
jgi:TolA-binding protein